MTQPLDFSAGVRKPAAPPPHQAPKHRPGGSKRRLVVLSAVAALAGATFLALVVFDVFADSSGTAKGQADPLYCQLAGQLDQVSLLTGAASAPGVYDGTIQQIRAAVDQMGASLEKLQAAAPKPIRRDVATVAGTLARAAGGDADAVKDKGFVASAQRAARHSVDSCGAADAGGDFG